MKIAILASTKGGAGKSTLAQALAVEASKQGRVHIIDLDPQQSVARWWDRRSSPRNPMLAERRSSLTLAVEVLRKREVETDWLIVDTPGSLMDKIQDAMKQADAVIAVLRPSLKDLEAQGALEDLISRTGKREKTIYVVNAASKTDKLTKDMVATLAERSPTPPMLICNRIDHARADIVGKTAAETNKDAAKEIAALWAAVKRIAQ